MKVLLRRAADGVYYAGEGKWAGALNAAQHFRHAQAAIQHAREAGLRGMELVLIYHRTGGIVVLPIQEGAAGADTP